ncbi:hypothetical protein PG987_002227 [Apiospora arundinis]
MLPISTSSALTFGAAAVALDAGCFGMPPAELPLDCDISAAGASFPWAKGRESSAREAETVRGYRPTKRGRASLSRGCCSTGKMEMG